MVECVLSGRHLTAILRRTAAATCACVRTEGLDSLGLMLIVLSALTLNYATSCKVDPLKEPNSAESGHSGNSTKKPGTSRGRQTESS